MAGVVFLSSQLFGMGCPALYFAGHWIEVGLSLEIDIFGRALGPLILHGARRSLVVHCPEISSSTSEAQAWHPARGPRPCKLHGLYVNGLNSPIQWHRVAGLLRSTQSSIQALSSRPGRYGEPVLEPCPAAFPSFRRSSHRRHPPLALLQLITILERPSKPKISDRECRPW